MRHLCNGVIKMNKSLVEKNSIKDKRMQRMKMLYTLAICLKKIQKENRQTEI